MVELLRDLRRVPCADCGLRYKPHQMDFDHRDPGTKSFNLMAGRAMLMPTWKVLAEVAKCDIVCVNCHRIRTRDAERSRVHRHINSRVQRAKLQRWRDQAAMLADLRAVPCADCKVQFEPCAMDFDHRDPATKRYTVSRMVGRAGTDAILVEVAKCDIVCANRHRVRTWRRAERE